MKTVIIGTPCYDGKVDCRFAHSIVESIALGRTRGIAIEPLYICGDAMIQRARNDILSIAHHAGVGDLVFIDSDQSWEPAALIELIERREDVIGYPVVKKIDIETYNVKADVKYIVENKNAEVLKVLSVGTGFLKISKQAISKLWDSSEKFKDGDIEKAWMCDVTFAKGSIYSEDVMLCEKLSSLGFEINLLTTYTIAHTGTKTWHGDFKKWIQQINLEGN